MRYVFTIWMDEASRESATEEEIQETGAAYGAYTEEVQGKGILVAGEGLQPASTSTTVRVRDGEQSVTDGPFAETKEQLGGFYLIDVESLDDALDYAKRLPMRGGSVEVRPAMVFDTAEAAS
jgi:hypothetical protein